MAPDVARRLESAQRKLEAIANKRKAAIEQDKIAVGKVNPVQNSVEEIKGLGLTPNSLKEIIESCKANQVARIKFGSIEINFAQAIPRKLTVEGATVAGPVGSDLSAPELLAEAELAQELIDDPLGYEQRMIDSHLRGAQGDYAENHGRQSQ